LLSLGALCGGAMLSCSTALARDVPAVIVQPTDQSRLVLQQVVSGALKRESVLLAGDALTQSSTLTIEPARVRDGQGQVIYDREVRTLERFYLVRSWWRCILIRENTGERFKLAHTQCVAKP
jgi:hypothetical protein